MTSDRQTLISSLLMPLGITSNICLKLAEKNNNNFYHWATIVIIKTSQCPGNGLRFIFICHHSYILYTINIQYTLYTAMSVNKSNTKYFGLMTFKFQFSIGLIDWNNWIISFFLRMNNFSQEFLVLTPNSVG